MLKKIVSYIDFDGNPREEELCFNFTQAEITMMELGKVGGLAKHLQKIISEKDQPKLIELWKKLILDSYGVKSPDGRQFIKSPELRDAFEQTQAFSDLFIELSTNAEAATLFVNGIVPQYSK